MFENKCVTVLRYFDEAEKKNNALCGVTPKELRATYDYVISNPQFRRSDTWLK